MPHPAGIWTRQAQEGGPLDSSLTSRQSGPVGKEMRRMLGPLASSLGDLDGHEPLESSTLCVQVLRRTPEDSRYTLPVGHYRGRVNFTDEVLEPQQLI